MDLDDFKNALDDLGIDYREYGVSLRVRTCPVCSRDEYAVLFRVAGEDGAEMFFGRCQSGSCLQNYSSFSYLLKSGMEYGDAAVLHGKDPKASLDKAFSKDDDRQKISGIDPEDKVVEKKTFVETDISGFIDVSVMEDHPASEYAVKRGYVEKFKDIIKIDFQLSAVVFVVRDRDGTVLGFQRRWIKPLSPAPGAEPQKTKSSLGFNPNKYLMEFSGDGPLAICEGPFTALSAFHFGYYGICTFSSSISTEQLDNIASIYESRGRNEPITVSVDKDAAGIKYLDSISSYFCWRDIPIQVMETSIGNDINDAWMKNKPITVRENDYIDPSAPRFPSILE